jgi:hypothetical protein
MGDPWELLDRTANVIEVSLFLYLLARAGDKLMRRRRITVLTSAASAKLTTSGRATPTVTVLKPLSLTAALREPTVVRNNTPLSAAAELLWWWSQVR